MTNLANYSDIRDVFDAFIRTGLDEARFSLNTSAEAVAWRHRANRFRSATENGDYKRISLSIKRTDPETVVLSYRSAGQLLTPDNEVVEVEKTDDALAEAAKSFARELNIGD